MHLMNEWFVQMIFERLLATHAHAAAGACQGTSPMHILAAAGLTNYLIAALEPHRTQDGFLTWINQIDAAGCTPLLLATRGNHTEVMQFVLDGGANPDWRDKQVC